jgi:hypothetical protein
MKTDREVQELFRAYAKIRRKGRAAMKGNMSRNTGAKYLNAGKLPSELKAKRHWRTHPDAFAEVWDEAKELLTWAPELEAKAIFEYLREEHGLAFSDGQLRSFQRRVRAWRALEGPDKEVFFAQEHRPGEALQWDFWDAGELGVTVAGEAFPHLLFHLVLPYSNWEHASICRSESMLAIRLGFNRALRKLQHVPRFGQSDSSSAATHRLGAEEELRTGKGRWFNKEYQDLIEHYGITPRTIKLGESQQNGDVEALHNGMKGRMRQYLLLRGSRDFKSAEAYQAWVDAVLEKANAYRAPRVAEELKHMRPLKATLVPEYREQAALVGYGSTINVQRNVYSVWSRLIGEEVRVRLFEERIEVYFRGTLQLTAPRCRGQRQACIDYRHIIHALVRKPGAFERYRYREEMFPTTMFRRTYDMLSQRRDTYHAAKEYLLILKLAAETMESDVGTALELLLETGEPFTVDDVRKLVGNTPTEIPALAPLVVRLEEYDALLPGVQEVAA